jgi:cytochrome c peroxidase
VPSLDTDGRRLPLAFPEVPTDPWQNVFYEVDLAAKPARFRRNDNGGVTVPLFADLKRHDMGDGLAESFSAASQKANREFTTARLWGVADSAPYLHDGRATTLSDAILAHGGEAQGARDTFASLTVERQAEVISFLRTLRTPKHPAARVTRMARRRF